MNKYFYAALMTCLTLMIPIAAAKDEAPQFTVEQNHIYAMRSGLALVMDVYRPEKSNGIGIIFISGSGWTESFVLTQHRLHKRVKRLYTQCRWLSRATLYLILTTVRRRPIGTPLRWKMCSERPVICVTTRQILASTPIELVQWADLRGAGTHARSTRWRW